MRTINLTLNALIPTPSAIQYSQRENISTPFLKYQKQKGRHLLFLIHHFYIIFKLIFSFVFSIRTLYINNVFLNGVTFFGLTFIKDI